MDRMPDETVLHAATSKSTSLRTTVPVMVTRHFKLEEGDSLRWEIKAKKKDEFEIIVTPLKKKNKGVG
jgi:bifunctional DNA-binding transcriptional regulator/antitoxin component of YhaV-PrlF toxin-antitoxin module